MTIIIGGLLILWGAFVLYSVLFKMKKQDYKYDLPVVKGRVRTNKQGQKYEYPVSKGVSGFIEFEFLLKTLSKIFPLGVIKGITIFIGISFVVSGMVLFFI